MTESYLI